MESTTPIRPSRHINSALDLMDEVLDNPYWSSFDGPDYDREVDIERQLADRRR